MAGRIETRLAELGIALPKPARPVATYIPYIVEGSLVFISGQVSLGPGAEFKGKVGRELSVEEGQAAARLCALNILAQLKAAVGDLDRVRACLRLGGFVNATPDFTEHPAVINGASNLLVEVFGDAGRHTRSAVGAGSLPLGVAVEIEATFAVS